jgi:hypothetical protein
MPNKTGYRLAVQYPWMWRVCCGKGSGFGGWGYGCLNGRSGDRLRTGLLRKAERHHQGGGLTGRFLIELLGSPRTNALLCISVQNPTVTYILVAIRKKPDLELFWIKRFLGPTSRNRPTNYIEP